MDGYAPRAGEDSVRPPLLTGASGRRLNFTVRAAPVAMARDFGTRFREAFAADLAAAPQMTLRHGDAIDSYASAPAPRAADAVTDAYLEQYCWGLRRC